MTAMFPITLKSARTGADKSRLSTTTRQSNGICSFQFLVFVFLFVTPILVLMGCSKTAKRPADSDDTTATSQKGSAPPPELALYRTFSNWIDAFNSHDADRMYLQCAKSTINRLQKHFAVHDVRTFDSLSSVLTDSLVFPFGARIIDLEVLDLTIQGSSGNITASYRLLWKDINEHETGIFSMTFENGEWRVALVSRSLSFSKNWWHRFGKNLEAIEETEELVFNEAATRVTFRYPGNWHVAFPVPVQYSQNGIDQASIVLDVPNTTEGPACRLMMTVVDSLPVAPDSVAYHHPGVTVYGPQEIKLQRDQTGLQWLVEHAVSGQWIRVIAVSNSEPENIEPHRKSIEKLLSTVNIITHRK